MDAGAHAYYYYPLGKFDHEPSWVACKNGQTEIVKLLLAAEPDVARVLFKYLFEEKLSITALRTLLESGADVNGQDALGNTPLFDAILNLKEHVKHGFYISNYSLRDLTAPVPVEQLLKKLIKAGANLNAKNKDEETVLHICKFAAIAELLLHNGAELEAVDKIGRTPLYNACSKFDRERVELFLSHGANPDGVMGQLPLCAVLRDAFQVSDSRVYDIVKLLLEKGANVNAAADDGVTPLMSACFLKDTVENHACDIIRALLDKGADLNITGPFGSPLFIAAIQGRSNKEAVKLLLESGAMGADEIYSADPEIAELLSSYRPFSGPSQI